MDKNISILGVGKLGLCLALNLEKKGYKWRDNVNINSLTQFNPFKDSMARI